MWRTVVSCLVSILSLVAADCHACGEKYLFPGRNPKNSWMHPLPRQASIVIYQSPSSQTATAISRPQYQRALRDAGGNVQVCRDATKCQEALRSGRFDVVLADYDDALQLKAATRDTASKPLVLPIVAKDSPTQVKKAKAEFGWAVEMPIRPAQVVAIVGQAIGAH